MSKPNVVSVSAEEIELSDAERETFSKAMLEGLAAAETDPGVPHEKVREWLLSWERGSPIPRPRSKPVS